MDRAAFDVYIETQLAPTLQAGDVLKARGAWFLFLPAYSPDLAPIEMAFAKLKAHLRAARARTYDALARRRRYLQLVRSQRMLELPQARRLYFRLKARRSSEGASALMGGG